jgi:hypothetical protein
MRFLRSLVRRYRSNLRIEGLEPRAMLSAVTIDNGQAGFATTGQWNVATNYPGWLNGDVAYSSVDSPSASATWTFTAIEPGRYVAEASWKPYASPRSDNVEYTIEIDGKPLTRSIVDQRSVSSDSSLIDVSWSPIGGEFYVSTGQTVVIRMTNRTSGFVVADAVRLRPQDVPADASQLLLFDQWGHPQTGPIRIGGTEMDLAWTDQAVTKTLTIQNASSQPIQLPEQTAINDFILGTWASDLRTLMPGQITHLNLQAISPDPIQISEPFRLVDASGNATFQSTILFDAVDHITVDDSYVNFQVDGDWSFAPTYMGWSESNVSYSQNLDQQASATWHLPQTIDGRYRILATWQEYGVPRTDDARYEILINGVVKKTVIVDQRLRPRDLIIDQLPWAKLAEDLIVTAGQHISVRLVSPGGGMMVADAVRIERTDSIPTTPTIELLGASGPIQTAGDTMVLAPFETRLSGSEIVDQITIRNVSAVPFALQVPIAPAGFRFEGVVAGRLIQPGETQTLTLYANSITAQTLTGRLRLLTTSAVGLAGVNLQATFVSVLTADNSCPNFSTTGDWTLVQSSSTWVNTSVTFNTSNTPETTATWSFPVLPPGLYQVQANWNAYTTPRSSQAQYRVVLGGIETNQLTVDQRFPGADSVDDGQKWTTLADNLVVETSKDLRVLLRNLADGYVVADAVRVVRLGALSAVVDDRGSGFSTTGTWKQQSQPLSYGGAITYSFSGLGDGSASWEFPVLAPGRFRLSATWYANSYHSKAASFTVQVNGKTVAVITRDQSLPANDLSIDSRDWALLLDDLYLVANDRVRVVLNNDTVSYVWADAIRLDWVDTIPTAAQLTVYANQGPLSPSDPLIFHSDHLSEVFSGDVTQHDITVRNIGTTRSAPIEFIVEGDGFELIGPPTSSSLDGGGAQTVSIRYTALETGAKQGRLWVIQGSQTIEIPLLATVIDALQSNTAIDSAAAAAIIKDEFVSAVWNGGGIPLDRLPNSVETNVASPIAGISPSTTVDRLRIDMQNGFVSYAFHFRPSDSNGRLIIYHQGHAPGLENDGGGATIRQLVAKGFDVIALQMPLFGPNTVQGWDYQKFQTNFKITDVQTLSIPIATAINYAEKWSNPPQSVDLIGVSGGGWTVTLYAALDNRVRNTISVAGTLPMYLIPDFNIRSYHVVGDVTKYLDLYLLSGLGPNRHFTQILNQHDSCCFAGSGYKTYDSYLMQLAPTVGANVTVVADLSHIQHKISQHALDTWILPTVSS